MNGRVFLEKVIALLYKNNIEVWIFGGWAEELQGIIKPRPHNDIDLLYPSNTFELVDSFIQSNDQITEIIQKKFHHKRAFMYKGVMIEIFLLEQNSPNNFFTNFFGKKRLDWPKGVLEEKDSYRLSSIEALHFYRKNHSNYSYEKLA